MVVIDKVEKCVSVKSEDDLSVLGPLRLTKGKSNKKATNDDLPFSVQPAFCHDFVPLIWHWAAVLQSDCLVWYDVICNDLWPVSYHDKLQTPTWSVLRVRGSKSRVLSHSPISFYITTWRLVTLRTDWGQLRWRFPGCDMRGSFVMIRGFFNCRRALLFSAWVIKVLSNQNQHAHMCMPLYAQMHPPVKSPFLLWNQSLHPCPLLSLQSEPIVLLI